MDWMAAVVDGGRPLLDIELGEWLKGASIGTGELV